MRELFEYLRAFLTGKYNISIQALKEDAPDQLGMFLYQGIEDKEDLCGEVVYECFKLHLQLVVGKSEDAIYEGLDFLRNVVDRLENEAAGNEAIEIVSIQHIGAKATPIGKNEHGYPELVSNLQVLYALTQVES